MEVDSMTQSMVEYPERVVVDLLEKAPIQILHVDDEAGFLKAAKQILEMQDAFEVDTASSVEEAEEKMKQKSYDVIVSDYVMPGKDGLEFLKQLRESGNKIPFITFTGRGREIVAIRALNLGADLYVNKIGAPEAVYSELAHGIRKLVEAKRAEDALVESEEKWRTLAEQLPNMIFVNKKGRVVYTNKRCEEIMGYKKEEFYSPDFDFLTLIHPGYRDVVKASFARQLKGEEVEPHECALLTKEGERIEAIITTKLIKYEGENAILGIITDIPERKSLEQELRDAMEKWVSLMENTNDVIMILDGKGTIQYLNPTPLAPNPREAIGKPVYEYVPREQHDIMRGSLRNVFKTGKPDSYEVSPNIQGIGTVWFNTKVVPIKHDGKTVSVILISTDITQRKQAEESLKATLERLHILNEKLGVVGKLTRHDARNKLSTVTINTFLIKQKLAHDPEALKHLSEIESACGEVEKIFEFARIYEKIGVEELAYMNVEKTLAEVVMLFSDLKDIKVVNDCRGLTVLADSLLRQLFYNLIDNSLKHGEKVEEIKVYYEEAGKGRLNLVYEDDGVGIRKAEKEKIFMEGYGKGTGYGLYMIRKMSEVYGWTIQETGKHGKGAQFTMTIPKTGKSGKDNYRLLKN